jgi:hypothetical protein
MKKQITALLLTFVLLLTIVPTVTPTASANPLSIPDMERAVLIPFGVSLPQMLHHEGSGTAGRETHVYRVDVPSAGTVELTVEHPYWASMNWFTADRQPMRGNFRSNTRNQTVIWDLDEGTYYFTFTATFLSAPSPNDVPYSIRADFIERDTLPSALEFGETVTGFFTESTDKNTFRVDLPTNGRLTIAARHGTITAAGNVRWLDANGRAVNSGSFSSTSGHNQTHMLDAGSYYIEVNRAALSSTSKQTGTYTITATFQSTGAPVVPPVTSPSEPGGTAPSEPGGTTPSEPGGTAPSEPGGTAPSEPGGTPSTPATPPLPPPVEQGNNVAPAVNTTPLSRPNTERAALIEFGQTHNFTLHHDGSSLVMHIFRVVLTEKGRLEITTEHPYYADMFWFNSERERISTGFRSYTRSQTTLIDLEAGTYYFTFTASYLSRPNPNDVSYSIRLDFEPRGCAVRPNNTIANAHRVDFGDAVTGFYSEQVNVEVFRYDLPTAGRLSIEAVQGTINDGGRIRWLDADGDELHSSSFWSSPRSNFMDLEAGSYFIEFTRSTSSTNQTTGTYTFTGEFRAASEGIVRTNTEISAALPITANTTVSSFLSEQVSVNAFRFTHSATTPVRVELEFDTVGAFYIHLRRPNGEQISRQSFFDSGTFEVRTALEAGTYYITVERRSAAGGNQVTGEYSLRLLGTDEPDPDEICPNTIENHPIRPDCQNCTFCGHNGGRFGFGRVTNTGPLGTPPTVTDALAILRYLVGLSSQISDCTDARAAANIVNPQSDEPNIVDGLQILRYLVGLSSPRLNATYPRGGF